MSEYHDKYAPKGAKDRVDRILRDDGKGKIDASDVKLPEREDMGKNVMNVTPKRNYKRGGKVEGEKAHHHAGRKSRDTGGNAVAQLRPQVPTSGLYGNGFSPTHSGMLAQGAGFKKGGDVKKHKRASGGILPGEAARHAQKAAQFGDSARNVADDRIRGLRDSDPVSSTDKSVMSDNLDKYIQSSQETGYPMKRGGEAKRTARAEGGRTKGKTNINIIIGAPKDQDQPPMVPPPPSAIPPGAPPPPPGLPPAAMGAMKGPVPAMGGGGPGPAMPPQMPPPGPMPRAHGGRAYPIDSGSRSGKARLEKAEAYGPK